MTMLNTFETVFFFSVIPIGCVGIICIWRLVPPPRLSLLIGCVMVMITVKL